MPDKDDEKLRAIIEPVVHGQIRSFRKAHGDLLKNGLASSLAKRIIHDLIRGYNAERLRAAILDTTETPLKVDVVLDCGGTGRDDTIYLFRPRRPAHHHTWPENRNGEVWAQSHDYCWVTPPGSKRPVTYAKEKLTFPSDEP